jgi:hypothetical protein
MEENNFLFPYHCASDECLSIQSRETKVTFFVTKYLLDCVIYCMIFLILGNRSGLFCRVESCEMNIFA